MFRVLGDVEHVLLRPGQYVGSTRSERAQGWVIGGDWKPEYRELLRNEALLKIVFEVIDNAVDAGGSIHVRIEARRCQIDCRGGTPIPVLEQDIGDGVARFVPETVFGHLRSGSNFEQQNKIGMNGIGVKATNILSTRFRVKCVDPERRKCFEATWTGNMGRLLEKRVTASALKTSLVQVEFEPDLAFFNKTPGAEHVLESLETSILDQVRTRLAGIAMNQISVTLNDEKPPFRSFRDFVAAFAEHALVHRVHTDTEIGIARNTASDAMEHMSFVNTQRTLSDKSTHTRAALRFFSKHIAKALSVKDVPARSLMIFVNTKVHSPQFASQTKDELCSRVDTKNWTPIPGSKLKKFLDASGLAAQIGGGREEKLHRKLDGHKTSQISVPKLDDAHVAGTRLSKQAMLFLVEGDSAKTMVATGMSVIGRKLYGVFPLRGKLMNASKKNKITENAEVANVIKILGLRLGYTYETEQQRETLRYGKVCCMTDSDHDGAHITGLILNFFGRVWPHLLRAEGFLYRFVTPVAKLGQRLIFDRHELLSCKSSDRVQLLKGLGTSTREDTLSYFRNLERHLRPFPAAPDTAELLQKIFAPENTQWRKDWLLREAPVESDAEDMSAFLHRELREFSLYNIRRAVPSALDGLKVSQRKVVFEVLRQQHQDPVKVAQLASAVAASTQYAHGEVSLQNTIVAMAQSFSGSNNVPLLTEDGAFGSRTAAGKDAASPRYIFTRMQPWTPMLFDIREPELLGRASDQDPEPEKYVPAMPLALLNGACGIATGFRSLLPCFNPKDVLERICSGCVRGAQNERLVPWYAGTYSTNHLTRETEDAWIFSGNAVETPEGTVVDEVPIGVSFNEFRETLQKKNAKILVDHVSENQPRFVVRELDDIKLTNAVTKSCMHLLDASERVRKFESPEEILEQWIQARIELLGRAKTFYLSRMRSELAAMELRAEIVRRVLEHGVTEIDRMEQTMRLVAEKMPLKTFSEKERRRASMDIDKQNARIEELEGRSAETWLVQSARAAVDSICKKRGAYI